MSTSVQLQVSINSGAWSTGAVQAAADQTMALQVASTSGLNAIRYEIYDYPIGMTTPSGWSQDPSTLAFFYAPTNVTTPPPVVTLPASGENNWGPLMLRVRGNGNPFKLNADGTPNTSYQPGLTDESTIVWIPSPHLAMQGIGRGMSGQLDTMRQWVGPIMQALRLLDNASSGGTFSAGGDLSGTSISQTVVGIHGATVPVAGSVGNVLQVTGANTLGYAAVNVGGGSAYVTGVLPVANGGTGLNAGGANGTVLTMVSGSPAWASPSASYTLAGDVVGALTSTEVQAVNGATVPVAGSLTAGNLLQVTGAATLGYAPLNLAGGSNYVTGVLPTGNQAAQSMVGDVTGTTAANTVAKVNGASVPAAGGALTTGNVLQVTGPSALGYAPINLSLAGSVGGTLGVSNGGTGLTALGADDALLGVNHVGSALYFFNPSQDMALASGVVTITGIRGIPVHAGAPADGQVLTYVAANSDYEWKTPVAASGAIQTIRVVIGTAATATSSTAIPAGARVLAVRVSVTTAYSAGATIEVGQASPGSATFVFGTGTCDSDLQTVNASQPVYKADYDLAWGASSLAVLVTIGGTPAAGAGAVTIFYATPGS